MINTRKHIIYIVLIVISAMSILLFSFYSPEENISETKASFIIKKIEDTLVSSAPKKIRFEQYDITKEKEISLVLSGTYGTIVLTPDNTSWEACFTIPISFTQRAGVVSYTLVQNKKVIQEGSFRLLSDTTKIGAIETYLGPRSIVANPRDYTMLVSIPTDTLDNMLPDSTQVELKTQFKNEIRGTQHYLNSGFVWKRINAPLQTGRISTGSILGDQSSKELSVDIFPDLAQDFIIKATSNHTYADGNEIITFATNQIKDPNNNIVTDGTLVTFFIKDDKNIHWQTNASTINGYAFAKALHPQTPSTWNIRAEIAGIAQSKEIQQQFTPIIEEIPLALYQNRSVIIGPLTSYLGQLVQNGIMVSIEINGRHYEDRTTDGKATFHLREEDYPIGNYTIKIQTLGLERSQNLQVH